MGNRTAQRALAAHSMDLLHATESAVALDKCQNRIRPFGGVSRFQREQAMNDCRGSIQRAPIESAMYRAARSKLQSCSGLLRPERVPVAGGVTVGAAAICGGLFMLLHAARRRWRYWQGPKRA